MRISMVAIGSTGDVRPYVLLGKELKKRGHEVTIMKRKKIPYDESEITVSATEQTGLIPALPLSDEEAESYETLYPIHKQK